MENDIQNSVNSVIGRLKRGFTRTPEEAMPQIMEIIQKNSKLRIILLCEVLSIFCF